MLELPDEPLCAAVSPNGNFIAFGLLDNTARVYYMDTLKFFVSLYGHSMPIYSIDISHVRKEYVNASSKIPIILGQQIVDYWFGG
jgi:U3 small nucleolar RNA-associated protein 12